jgi:ethanolamine utilization protein EutM
MSAIGMIEVEGIAGIIVAGDAACKTAAVELLGWETIGGYTTIFFSGSVGDVAAALERGVEAAREVVDHVVGAPLNQPEAVCRGFVSSPIDRSLAVAPDALGLIEARGYGVHVFNNDQMVKTAPVQVRNVLTVHNRVVCTLIQGEVGAVRQAIDTARTYLGKNEFFMGTAVIPQPVPEILQTFGAGR